jgi:hypothetical protein
VLIGVGLALAILAALGLSARPRAERWLRATVVAALEQRLDSDVELGAITLQPGLLMRISGGPLAIRHRGRRDIAPLIQLERFDSTISWRQMIRRPRRVDTIALAGLAIAIPPSPGEGQPRFSGALMHPGAPAGVARPPVGAKEDGPSGVEGRQGGGERKPPAVIIGRITADAATLVVLPRDRRKFPRRFVLHQLTVRDVSTDRPLIFESVIENPLPLGRIESAGTFGPWDVASPARTPLQARYRLVDADLNTIRGIAGVLQSEGTYGGVLERIEAVGTSTTPAFDLDVGGRPLPLTARFTVVVDGTNGNTYIQPAEAVLGAGTPIRVTGASFTGRFRMADGVIAFPALSFDVDGARVDLAGRYVVAGQGLHFDGRIRLDAGVSRMVRGKKGLLLRPFDGLFRRNGVTEFPISIRGTVQDPAFGVDVKATLGRALLPGR